MTWKWWWKTVQKIWYFFFHPILLSFHSMNFPASFYRVCYRSKNGHTSFQNMTFLFLLGSLNRLVIKCSKVYLRIWLYSLDKCNNKIFKTWVRLSQKNFTLVPVSQSFVQIGRYFSIVVPMYEFSCLILPWLLRSKNGVLHFKTRLLFSFQFIEYRAILISLFSSFFFLLFISYNA